jgi:putative selenate reductase
MSDRMRPVPFRELVLRSLAEYRVKGSIFDIPQAHFWTPSRPRTARIFSSSADNPVGPAAGPHTQLSQNIVAAWLAGGRYIELKTVQKLDALTVEKPCIDAADEGYNVEWSTELSLDQAYDEYLKAWLVVHVLQTLLSQPSRPAGTLFNMSVGYDLEGIKTERMDRFIDRLIDSSKEPLLARYLQELADLAADPSLLDNTPWRDKAGSLRELPSRIPARICSSVTLSTMHGCPPGEIESICAYMLERKKLDTLVKLNPTLLGYDRARELLSQLGFGSVTLKPEGFAKDLQYGAAVPMLTRLLALGRRQGKHFGAKLSNTLAAANTRKVLPGEEMYMSGRALYPLTVNLAGSLAREFKGSLPLSFSGGISAWNIGEILDAGIRPITLATDLLKPGGYARLKELAEICEAHDASWNMTRVNPRRAERAAEAAQDASHLRKEFRGTEAVRVAGPLPLFDCFVAPCTTACPINQDVPEYIHLAGEGRYEEAFEAIYRLNPLPFMTGYLCDHACTGNCTRMDWEGAVRIREVKRIAAERGYDAFRARGTLAARKSPDRGAKAAVVGAGPAGLAAASFLSREGFEVHVFERESAAGGIVRWLLPPFRIPQEAVEKDASLLFDLGVRFHYGVHELPPAADLKAQGYRYVLAGIGAEADREAGVPGALEVLGFLRRFRSEPSTLRLGRKVVVVGAGDTAMDAARAARRCRGVKDVRIVYRRSEQEMPASRDEYESARAEGIRFHFHRAPESWSPGAALVCRVMEPGAPDESGRSRPVPTASTEDFAADTVITAVGADVDAAAIGRLGLGGPIDPETQETAVPGVFLIGDAAQGAATIVKAIASARRAVGAILARDPGTGAREISRWGLPAEDAARLRGLRDGLIPVSGPDARDEAVRVTESSRCLGCRALCIKCVEVCPNRANTLVKVKEGFRDEFQIVHLDAFCNECGNCATFCPWDGRPYRDKLTVFAGEQDFRDSTNPGFFLRGGKGLIRVGDRIDGLALDAAGNPVGSMDPTVAAAVRAIVRDYPFLLGGAT